MSKKNQGFSKGKRTNEGTKNPSRDDRRSRAQERDAGGKRNHVSWYVPDVNMLMSAASIPFNYRTGDPIDVHGTTWTMPGIAALSYTPVYGDMTQANDAINQAATAVYSWIRHVNSGSRNYDATDLMLYLMAMDSIYSGISYCQRALTCAMVYARENRYTPDALLQAMGVYTDGGTFYGKLNEYRLRLNNMILKAATLAVPATFPIYMRHAFMCQNIYTDESNAFGQFYLFKPASLYIFGLDKNSRGCLTPISWANDEGWQEPQNSDTVRHFDDYLNKLDQMISALYGDEDAGIMAGDILKAYGSDKLFAISTLPADAVLVPVYDPEMLNQIHNATVVGPCSRASVHGFNVIQQHLDADTTTGTSGYLTQIVAVLPYLENKNDVSIANLATVLDIHGPTDPEWVMRSTRLMASKFEIAPYSDSESAHKAVVIIKAHGSEIINKLTWFRLDARGELYTRVATNLIDAADVPTGLTLTDVATASTFSFFPILWVPAEEGSTALVPVGNFDRLTRVTPENIAQLHDVAILGLFNVPRLTLA